MSDAKNTIPIIINPASGKPKPILNTISKTFRAHELAWKGHITYKFGDATRFAKKAVASGADMVVVYGGDGTVLEVVNAVMGSTTRIGILPGGTGNAVAIELGIPRELGKALELVCKGKNFRFVDVAQADDRFYILRAYTGIGEDQAASRESKDKLHLMAYPIETIKTLKNPPHAKYTITIDGEKIEAEAMTCFVNNLANLGGIDVKIGTVTPDDGLLDVMIVSKNRKAIKELGHYVLSKGNEKTHAYHGKGKKVTIDADPPQTIWLDGEFYKNTPVTIRSHPKAVKIIVP